MTTQQPKLPHDFDTWPESAQNAYRLLYQRTQAAETIIENMQATFSEETTVSSLMEGDRTPTWRTIMLHTLNDLFRKAATSLDIQDVLDTVARIITQLLQSTGTYICDWNSQNKTATVLAEYVSDAANEAEKISDIGESYDLTQGFEFRLLRQDYWINHEDSQLNDDIRDEFGQYSLKTVLYVPMISEDQLIGHIEIWESRSKREYSKRQIEFVTALARQIASIVRTAQLHRALRESEARFRLVMRTMREGLVQVDPNNIIEFANERFGQMLECNVDDLIGKPLTDVWTTDHDLQSYEITLEREFSKPISVHISQAPLVSDKGHPLGSVYVYTDITKRKQAEQSIIDLGVEKERVRILTQFVQDASHEFYTPLSNIGTYTYLLSRHLDDESYQGHLSIIREQANSIRDLISALVVMTNLDSTSDLKFTKSNMTQLVISAINNLKAKIKANQHKLSLDLELDYIPIECDVEMLLLALSNIVDNAIRYTPPEGSISVQLKQENDTIEFSVEDTGVGMSEDVQVQIFQRFYREDTARSTRGFGLGMTIVKRIIDLHLGEILVESEVGQGTRIRISLPLVE